MSEQYDYKFKRVKIRGGGWTGNFAADYQQVIRDHAAQGWRFVQAVSPAIMGYGAAKFMDLVFERKAP